MNRRKFILAATATPFAAASAGDKPKGEAGQSYRIVMIDPRLITKTRDTLAVGWERKKSDVMGSVYLSYEESAKLKTLLKTALTDSTNVPFCGHSPAYVVEQLKQGRASSYVSVCALCMTWCGADGQLRALEPKELMPFLNKVLPLPAAFAKVKELPDLWKLDAKKSFLELPSAP